LFENDVGVAADDQVDARHLLGRFRSGAMPMWVSAIRMSAL
jgi:hypothetical protein